MKQPAIERVGILYQTKQDAPVALAAEIARYLSTIAVQAFEVPLGSEQELLCQDIHLLVTLGGDGSLLRAARCAAEQAVPVFGINFGRLGFLTECQPDQWQPALDRVLAGHYRRERRALLSVRVDLDGARGPEYLAVNDVAMTRGDRPRAIRARLHVDGAEMGEIVADGIVCSTATGSTGYNLSNGGPILPPEYRGYVVTAVAPHLSWIKPLVLEADTELVLSATGSGGVLLTVDSQVDVPIHPDQHIHVRSSAASAVFARTRSGPAFYESLRTRLQFRQ